MAGANNWSNVIAKDRRSQFCFNYGKQEEDPADHTIHLEIQNFLEFTKNETKTKLTTGDVDFQGSKWFVSAYMESASAVAGEEPPALNKPRFMIAVCCKSDQPPLVSISAQFVHLNDTLTSKHVKSLRGNKFVAVVPYDHYTCLLYTSDAADE